MSSFYRSTFEEDEDKRITQAFDSIDKSGKGYLTKREFKLASILWEGCRPSKVYFTIDKKLYSSTYFTILDKFEVETLFETSESVLSRNKFIAICKEKRSHQCGVDGHIRTMFKLFDEKNQSFITKEVFKNIFSKYVPWVPKITVNDCFEEIDADQDGRISYREFEKVFKFPING